MQMDIVIVGGGLVGASLALALGQAPGQRLKIMLVDASPLSPQRTYSPSFQNRTTALSLSSKVIYQKLGIWELVQAFSCPISVIHVSEKSRWGATRLLASEHGLTEFGYVAANEVIGQALLSSLVKQQKVILEASSSVTEISAGESGYNVTIASVADRQAAFTVATKMLVIADGGRSNLLAQLGIELLSQDYQQQAIVANVTSSLPHHGTAYERFTDSGAMALLPMPDLEGRPRYSLVWTLNDDAVDGVLSLSDSEFLAQLQQQIGFRCGKFMDAGPRNHYPLSLVKASQQVKPGLVVLGNAAHTLHPVAGQGYNLSLRDAMTLAALVNRVTTPDELSSGELVSQYVKRQLSDQQRVTRGSDILVKLFGSDLAMVRKGRQFGLIVLNQLLPLKHRFAEMAMGISGKAADWQN